MGRQTPPHAEVKLGEQAQMRYAKRTAAAWAVTTFGGFLGWLVSLREPTIARAVYAIALIAGLTFLPALLLGAINTLVIYRGATVLVGALSFRVVQVSAEQVHRARAGSALDFVNAGFELLLIPVFGVGVALVAVGVSALRRPAATS